MTSKLEGDQIDLSQMSTLSKLCRAEEWHSIASLIELKPSLAMTPFANHNFHTTTILHQAICSKGNVEARCFLILRILEIIPAAAALKNQHGSLPIHTISQRCTKMTAKCKEEIIKKLIQVYPQALLVKGGVSKRTPLHILFTDFVSPSLTRFVLERGRQACFMTDRKGYLPAHVACSRHASPEKLKLLLTINPAALYETTPDGHTLLSLALSTATAHHPNYKLIDVIRESLQQAEAGIPKTVSADDSENTGGDHPKIHGKYKLLKRGRTLTLERTSIKRARTSEGMQLVVQLSRHKWSLKDIGCNKDGQPCQKDS